MSRVTKAYKNEQRRSTLFNKDQHGFPSQRTSGKISDCRSSNSVKATSRSDTNLPSDSLSEKLSTIQGTVGEGTSGSVAQKLCNVGLGDSSVSLTDLASYP